MHLDSPESESLLRFGPQDDSLVTDKKTEVPVKTLVMILLISFSTQAADLNQIFDSSTPTSPAAALALTSWLKANCKDLNWALSVKEISSRYENCGDGLEKVHLNVELSHQPGEMIFWIKNRDEKSEIEWIYEEWPSWHVCSNTEAYLREDKTCKATP